MKRITIICLLVFRIFLTVHSQTIISSTPATSLICPGASTNYLISYPAGYTTCSISWSIIKGSGNFNGSSTIPSVDVTWDDQKPNKVTIQAVVKYLSGSGSCTSPETTTLTFTHTLRSVFGELITAAAIPTIPYCAAGINVSVDHMYIKNTGGISQPPLAEVNNYQWTIPAGWKESVTNKTGTIYTTINAVSIEPTAGGNCSAGGNIFVRGIAGLSSCAGFLVSQSNSKTITISRNPSFVISASGGYTGQHQCGQTTPITFSVPSLDCAISYSWNFPSGWSGSSTSNTIVLTPGGGVNVVGPITVTTSINNGLCTLSSTPFQITYNSPYISVAPTICSGGTNLTLNNVSPNTSVTWSVSNNLKINSGQGTPNAVVAALTSSTSGTATIDAILNCPNTVVPTKSVWSGVPNAPGPFIVDPSPMCVFQFSSGTINYVPGADSYNWIDYSPWIDAVGGSISGAVEALRPGGYNFYIQASNVCGMSESLYSLYVKSTHECDEQQYLIYPNPTSSILIIESAPAHYNNLVGVIYNEKELLMKFKIEKKKTEISLLGLPDGRYFIRINESNKNVLTKQILIKH